MNGQAIIDKFENHIDDAIDETYALQLANDAKDEIEDELDLEINKRLNSSNSTSVGQTHTTTAVNLGNITDFGSLIDGQIWVGTTLYSQVPFEDRQNYINNAGYFYVDPYNLTLHLCGTQGSVQTIHVPYHSHTADFTVSTSPRWPSRFHSIIPLKMAQMFYAIDGGDKARAWDDRWGGYYERKLNSMRDWDHKMKLNALNGSAFRHNQDTEVDIGLM